MRGAKKKGVRYFGPYSHAWAIRETLDLLLRVFPARTCSAGVFKRAGQVGRPCLLGYIGKCSAPVRRPGRAPTEHREIVEDFCDFMAGQTTPFLRRLEKDMQVAAANQEYERAARLRDDIKALERAMEKQAVVLGDGTDADVIALRRGPARGSRAGLLRAWRPGPRAARLGGRQGRGPHHRRPGRALPPAGVRRVRRRAGRAGWGDSVPARGAGAGAAAGRRGGAGVARVPAREQRRPAGAAARGQARR